MEFITALITDLAPAKVFCPLHLLLYKFRHHPDANAGE